MKKCLSLIVAFALFAAFLLSPASAGGLIGNLETDIQIVGLSELGVRTLVSRYFAQRKAYLQGTSDTISTAVTPMATDESAHKEALAEANTVLVNSVAAIDMVIVEDYMARVEATEAATFMVNGETVQESIAHTISVYPKGDGSIIVCSDGYAVVATGFSSASYVNTEAVELSNITLQGSPRCIVNVAYQEVGSTYPVDVITKYGYWYGDLVNDPAYGPAAWCAMFVSWCAYHTDIPNYIIPCEAYCPTMAEFFANQGRYYRSASGGGSYVPEPGDIVFFGYNDNDTFLSPGHVGIVTLVSGGVVYIVDGNVTTYVDGVKMKTVSLTQKSLTSTDILAYGNPGYMNDSHTIESWEYDDYVHVGMCEVCFGEVSEYHELVQMGDGYGCCICDYFNG